MAHSLSDIVHESDANRAAKFLEDYVLRRNGKPLTLYDERNNRLIALYNTNQIKNGEFNMDELHELVTRIYKNLSCINRKSNN
jgi:hypothetical protein